MKEKITKAQAKILRYLLSGGEIREREGGFFAEEDGWRVSINAANGLINRGMLVVAATQTMPSAGLLSSPVLDDRSITKKGIEAIEEFIHHLDWRDSPREWEDDIRRGIEEFKERGE